MYKIFDCVCKVLFKIIVPNAAVYASLRSWRLPHAMLIHMPQPLGKLEKDASVESTQSFNSVIQQLNSLPASYFEVIANIAAIEQGKALILSDGYLRRALDKLTVSLQYFQIDDANKTTLPISELLTKRIIHDYKLKSLPSTLKLDIAACLRVICSCANFCSPRLGNANDLILHNDYSIISLCVLVLHSPSETILKDDICVEMALKTFSMLSLDCLRIADEFGTLHVMELVANIMERYKELSEIQTKYCVVTILNVATGLRETPIARLVSTYREQVFRVSRLFPNLSKLVQDTLWAMSRDMLAVIDTKEVAEDSIEYLLKISRDQEEEEKAMKEKNLQFENPPGRPGTYNFCGPSSCGSLRLPHNDEEHSRYHGEYAKSPNKADTSDPLNFIKIPMSEGACDLSKESARDQSLKDVLLHRKVIYGFAEKIKPDENNGIKDLLSPSRSSNNNVEMNSMKNNTMSPIGRMSSDKSLPELTMPRNSSALKTPIGLKSRSQRKQRDGNSSDKKKKKSSSVPDYADSYPVIIDVSDMPELSMTRPPPRP